MLKIGKPAPNFVLPDADMDDFDLASLRGKQKVILLFYPKDNSPNCTLEITDFSDHDAIFAQLGYAIIGINKDSCAKHAAFCDKHGIAIPLLSDETGKTCVDYGVWQEKEIDGQKHFGITRSTFLLDEKGIIRHIDYGVVARGHVLEVLHLIKTQFKN